MSLGAPLGTTEVIFCDQKRSICLTAKKERQSVLQFEFIKDDLDMENMDIIYGL